jgi:hypothetical protein
MDETNSVDDLVEDLMSSWAKLLLGDIQESDMTDSILALVEKITPENTDSREGPSQPSGSS